MKIKVKPEDFIVEEEAKINFRKGGRFKVYLLIKKNFNTIDVLIKLSQKLKIAFSKFSYGGRKDRYGLTSQYITIEGVKIKDIKEKSFELNYLGDTDRPMGPDLISANRFKIVIRKLQKKEVDWALKEVDFVKNFGFPNYFDDQRFGNYSPQQGFLAERLVRKEFNGALKIYLTAVHPEDKKEEKIRKIFFFENWKNWDKCLEKAMTAFEKKAFAILKKGEKNSFLKILYLIPREELSMYISSYQAYLWNNLVERLIRFYSDELLTYKGKYWVYVFYKSAKTFDYFKNLSLPLASQKTSMPTDLSRKMYEEILRENNLKPTLFNLRKFRKVYFKPTPRRAIVVPQIEELSFSNDEVYKGMYSLLLNFRLPRGSYGTMLVKRIMAK